MTPRERVIRTVRFTGPDKLACHLPSPYRNDFLHVNLPSYTKETKREGNIEITIDEFGCPKIQDTSSDITFRQPADPPLDDYSKLKNYPFPDYKNIKRYEELKSQMPKNKEDKFVLVDIHFSISHRLEYLRGFERAYTDPYEHPDELCRLLDTLTDLGIDMIDGLLKTLDRVDGVMLFDDWGTQTQSFVRPEIFADFWKPRYKRFCDYAHKHNVLVFLHSCGYITELLPHFIDAGIDVIQIDQQVNMGLETLSKRFGGKICFWAPVDIQKVMVEGSIDDVREWARKLIDSFGVFNGGFIAKWYPEPEVIGHSWEKIEAMCQEFMEYGDKAIAQTKKI